MKYIYINLRKWLHKHLLFQVYSIFVDFFLYLTIIIGNEYLTHRYLTYRCEIPSSTRNVHPHLKL